jgi:hypothetical protein
MKFLSRFVLVVSMHVTQAGDKCEPRGNHGGSGAEHVGRRPPREPLNVGQPGDIMASLASEQCEPLPRVCPALAMSLTHEPSVPRGDPFRAHFLRLLATRLMHSSEEP